MVIRYLISVWVLDLLALSHCIVIPLAVTVRSSTLHLLRILHQQIWMVLVNLGVTSIPSRTLLAVHSTFLLRDGWWMKIRDLWCRALCQRLLSSIWMRQSLCVAATFVKQSARRIKRIMIATLLSRITLQLVHDGGRYLLSWGAQRSWLLRLLPIVGAIVCLVVISDNLLYLYLAPSWPRWWPVQSLTPCCLLQIWVTSLNRLLRLLKNLGLVLEVRVWVRHVLLANHCIFLLSARHCRFLKFQVGMSRSLAWRCCR